MLAFDEKVMPCIVLVAEVIWMANNSAYNMIVFLKMGAVGTT